MARDLFARQDLRATPVKLWAHLLHVDGQDAPVAVADVDAHTLDEFNAQLKPVAERILRETDPRKGG